MTSLADKPYEEIAEMVSRLRLEAEEIRRKATRDRPLDVMQRILDGFVELRTEIGRRRAEHERKLTMQIRIFRERTRRELKAIHDSGGALRQQLARAEAQVAEGRTPSVPKLTKAERTARIAAAIREREEREAAKHRGNIG